MDKEKHIDPLFSEIKSKADHLEIKPKSELFGRISDMLDADDKKPVRKIKPFYNTLAIAASFTVLLGCFWFIKNNINNTGNRQFASATVFENLEDRPITSLTESIYNSSNIVKSINAYYVSEASQSNGTRLIPAVAEISLDSNNQSSQQTQNLELIKEAYKLSSKPGQSYSSNRNSKLSKIKSSKIDEKFSTVAALLGNWKFADIKPTNGANFHVKHVLSIVNNLKFTQEGNHFFLNLETLNNANKLSLKLDQSKIGGNTYLFREHIDSNQLLINIENSNQLNIGLMPNVSNPKLEKNWISKKHK